MELDNWQKEVLTTKGNICLCSGRQVGKSTVISIKAGEFAVNNPKKTIMIISAVERQALLLFEKTLSYIHDNYKNSIKKGKDKPTKHTLRLTNGSVIHCLPTGLSGYGIRGYTIDMLFADEAHFIPEDVWAAVTPMLAVSGGDIVLLSTPVGRQGYFWRCSEDENFTQFRVSSESCERIDKDFLKREKEQMSKLQYKQEYLGQFVDKEMQFFPDDIIKKCMILSRSDAGLTPFSRDYFLGVDIARMGDDESTFEIVERLKNDMLLHRENIVTTKTLTTMTTAEILRLNKKYDFKQIFIDAGGMGIGVLDQLLTEVETRRKTIAIDHEKSPLEYGGYSNKPRKKSVTKEDIYNNLLRLMERGEIQLLDDPEIYQSLRSVQYEYTKDDRGRPKFRIFGRYIHIADGLVRAAWCVKRKSLNLHIHYV